MATLGRDTRPPLADVVGRPRKSSSSSSFALMFDDGDDLYFLVRGEAAGVGVVDDVDEGRSSSMLPLLL